MSEEKHGNGIGILSLLGLLFIGLKLTGHIDWGWEWVTAPFWIPVAFALVVVGMVFVVTVVFKR